MSIQKMEIFGSDKSVSMSLQFQKVDKLIRQEEDNTGGIFNYIFLLVIYACTQWVSNPQPHLPPNTCKGRRC